jgi:hypothetical protein
MAMVLFVTASIAVLAGFVGLIAGRMSRTLGCKRGPRTAVPAREQGTTTGVRGSRQAIRSIHRRRVSTMT